MFVLRTEMYEMSGALIGAISRDHQKALEEGIPEDSRVVRQISEDLASVKNILKLLDDTSCPVFFVPMFSSTFRELEQKYLFRHE